MTPYKSQMTYLDLTISNHVIRYRVAIGTQVFSILFQVWTYVLFIRIITGRAEIEESFFIYSSPFESTVAQIVIITSIMYLQYLTLGSILLLQPGSRLYGFFLILLGLVPSYIQYRSVLLTQQQFLDFWEYYMELDRLAFLPAQVCVLLYVSTLFLADEVEEDDHVRTWSIRFPIYYFVVYFISASISSSIGFEFSSTITSLPSSLLSLVTAFAFIKLCLAYHRAAVARITDRPSVV
ncbi:MAG: hypothetical protein ACXAE3_06155 [Candidatus Kariarchaeaceae archaeon]